MSGIEPAPTDANGCSTIELHGLTLILLWLSA